jgi:hypothetical protein
MDVNRAFPSNKRRRISVVFPRKDPFELPSTENFHTIRRMTTPAIVEALLEKDESFLFAELGTSIRPVRLAATAPDKKTLEASGRRWYEQKKAELTKLICMNERLRQFASDPQISNRTQIVSLVIDILVSSASGIPVATLTALILKEGLQSFCRGCYEQTSI